MNIRGKNKKTLALFAEWMSTPNGERVPRTQSEFAKIYHVSKDTVSNWRRMLEMEKFKGDDDNQVSIFMKNLYTLATKPNARSKDMELWARINGLLVDKSELTHKFELSADDHYRISREAERRISETIGTSDRAESLPREPALLLSEVRDDTGLGEA